MTMNDDNPVQPANAGLTPGNRVKTSFTGKDGGAAQVVLEPGLARLLRDLLWEFGTDFKHDFRDVADILFRVFGELPASAELKLRN